MSAAFENEKQKSRFIAEGADVDLGLHLLACLGVVMMVVVVVMVVVMVVGGGDGGFDVYVCMFERV